MNNLVISIVAVALAVVLAGASAFYGGNIITENRIDSSVAKYLNESSQINSAITLYKSDGNSIDANFEVHFLVEDDYLKQIPEGWEKIPGSIGVSIPETVKGFSEQVCFTANEKMGFTFNSADSGVEPYSKDTQLAVPYCDKEGLSPTVPCCIMQGTAG